MASQSYFIILTVRTGDLWNHDRLEWLLNCILSFAQSVHATYEPMTDYRQCGAHSGSPQLHSYGNCYCEVSQLSIGMDSLMHNVIPAEYSLFMVQLITPNKSHKAINVITKKYKWGELINMFYYRIVMMNWWCDVGIYIY